MSNDKIKIIFIGTSDFGLPALRALMADPEFNVATVITQPDKKTGRKQILTPSPVKTEALKLGLTVLQPDKIGRAAEEIVKATPDLVVVVAYAQIIPENILAIPRFGCINIHASLLPRCRGAACVQGAILSGDGTTGVTIMKMDKGLDTGPVLAQKSIPIAASDNAGDLFEKLSVLSAEFLISTLKRFVQGEIIPRPQGDSGKSYFCVLKKQDGRVDWTKPAEFTEKFIRAMTPWPGAFGYFEPDDKIMLKVIETNPKPRDINRYKPGTLFVGKNELLIQCGQNSLAIKKLQLSGKGIVTAADFLRGNSQYLHKILR